MIVEEQKTAPEGSLVDPPGGEHDYPPKETEQPEERLDARAPDELHELPCKLTDAELTERRDRLAQTIDSISGLKAEKTSVNAGFTARIKASEALVGKLATEINTRVEYRSVGCIKREVPDRRCVETVRQDTEEVVFTRAMTMDEMQLSIWGPGERIANAAAAASGTGPRAPTGDAPNDPTASVEDQAKLARADGVEVLTGTCEECGEKHQEVREVRVGNGDDISGDVFSLICFGCKPYTRDVEAGGGNEDDEAQAELIDMGSKRPKPRKAPGRNGKAAAKK